MKGGKRQTKFVRGVPYTITGPARHTRTLYFVGKFSEEDDLYFVFRKPRKPKPAGHRIVLRRPVR